MIACCSSTPVASGRIPRSSHGPSSARANCNARSGSVGGSVSATSASARCFHSLQYRSVAAMSRAARLSTMAACCSSNRCRSLGGAARRSRSVCPADSTPQSAASATAGKRSRNRACLIQVDARRLVMRQWSRSQAPMDTAPSAAHSPEVSRRRNDRAKAAACCSCSRMAAANSVGVRTISSARSTTELMW